MLDIKATLRRIVNKIGSGKVAAYICGAPESQLSDWQSETDKNATCFIPIDHLMLADKAAGDIFLRAWAAERGYELTKIDSEPAPRNSLPNIIGLFAKRVGDAVCTGIEISADGIETPAEKRRFRDALAPVKDAIDSLESAIV